MIFRYLLILLLLLALPAQVPAAPPLPHDITMMAGEDYYQAFKHTTASGAILNLTGYRHYAQFRSAPAPAGILYATYSTAIIDAATGKSKMTLSKAQTQALNGKTGVWDLLQVDPADKYTYLRSGKVVVAPTTTRVP